MRQTPEPLVSTMNCFCGTPILWIQPESPAARVTSSKITGASPVGEFEWTSRALGLVPTAVRFRSPDAGFDAEIPVTYGNPFRRRALPIFSGGRAIGALWQLGQPRFNDGRAVVLPTDAPLALRLFVLAWATGGRVTA